ncbi:hemicentin-1-like [Dendropsophus ebraccatus]|uniref:hemicentin-1-like n=1 Tax=Dendropsophus ebraccatus TaxID=150705 RepID=UPI0038314F76
MFVWQVQKRRIVAGRNHHGGLGQKERKREMTPQIQKDVTCVEAKIDCTVTRNGGSADLTCKISSHLDIVQVTWQKRTENSYDTLVTHSKRFGVKISPAYENRLSVPQTKDPGTSSITVSQLEKEDGACFTAIFNIYPNGALKGEICVEKLNHVKEVVCKSPPDFSVTLKPPEINTEHSDPQGATIQIGRWLNDTTYPECNFRLRKEARRKRSLQDEDEIFTIECKASGTETPTITWNDQGKPISKEEKVNITGDFITVTSKRHHSLSTFPEDKEIRCNISYNKDNGPNNVHAEEKEKSDLCHEKNLEPTMIRILILSLLLIACVAIGAIFCFLKRKPPSSPKKYDKAETGSATPPTHQASIKAGNSGTVTRRNGSAMKKGQRKTEDNSYTPTYTEEKAHVTWLLCVICITNGLGEVLIEKNYKVGLFKPVTLKCIMTDMTSNVVQISWLKNGKNIASYHSKDQVYIVPGFEGYLNINMENWNVTWLTLFRANITDAGKYSCVFNTFPGGSKTGETSLQIYEPLNVTVSKNKASGPLTITCVARSWPPPVVSWLDVDEGSLNCTTYDGLLTVTSWIQTGSQQKMPKCKVIHLHKESIFSVSTDVEKPVEALPGRAGMDAKLVLNLKHIYCLENVFLLASAFMGFSTSTVQPQRSDISTPFG